MTDIFNLSPEQFHQQEDTERRADQERREVAERIAREKAEDEADKKARVAAAHANRWQSWLTAIGTSSGLPFEVRVVDNTYRPRKLFVKGIRVPVSEGMGQGASLEIHLPWYTAGYDSWKHRRHPVDKCSSRQKKDGSFNYEALGAMAKRYVEAEIEHARQESAKLTAAGVVKNLTADIGYSNMEPSTDPAKPVRFKFSLNRDMTEAEARAAHAALVLAGLIK